MVWLHRMYSVMTLTEHSIDGTALPPGPRQKRRMTASQRTGTGGTLGRNVGVGYRTTLNLSDSLEVNNLTSTLSK